MQVILSLGLGYLIGCISPAAILGKIKKVDLKSEGTKNLGATNTMLLLGRASGFFVMFFDILKSFFAGKLAKLIFPQLAVAHMLACIGTIIGHCFPVFMNFKGGKGLAAFGGLALEYNPWFFVIIVIPGVILMTIFNTGVTVPIFGSIVLPILVYLQSGNLMDTALALVASVIILIMHWGNLKKAIADKDVVKVRSFYKNILFKKKDKE